MPEINIIDFISGNPDETLIYAADTLAQDYLLHANDPHLHTTHCGRILPCVNEDDIVVLSGKLDQEYYRWLRTIDLGPKHVISYNCQDDNRATAQLILDSPKHFLSKIPNKHKPLLYIPYYSDQLSQQSAQALGADYFGASPDIVEKYHQKISFKSICHQLGLPTIPGEVLTLSNHKKKDFETLKKILHAIPQSDTFIIRGDLSSYGSSVYTTTLATCERVFQQLLDDHNTTFLVEPLMDVTLFIADCWVINRDAQIKYLDTIIPEYTNFSGKACIRDNTLIPKDILEKTRAYSQVIANAMRDDGYIGFLGIDYIVTSDHVYAVENNARMCSSTFPLFILDKIRQQTESLPVWQRLELQLQTMHFEQIQNLLQEFLYDGSHCHAIFPYHCDKLPVSGEFQVLIMGANKQETDDLRQAMSTRLAPYRAT